MTGQSDHLLRRPTPMLDRMANQAATNQIIIQIGDLSKACAALETKDERWNQITKYLAAALVVAESIK